MGKATCHFDVEEALTEPKEDPFASLHTPNRFLSMNEGAVPTLDELNVLWEATLCGDNLPNTTNSLEAQVPRRALLVGVQYLSDSRNTYGRTLYTPNSPKDIFRVYNMLLICGYQPQNIRILVSGITGEPWQDPTKENIMTGLEWLFHGARPGDHRYFHFSGHGQAYEVGEGEGKAARVRPVSPTTGEVTHPNPTTSSEQLRLSPPTSQITFFREALLTEWKHPSVIDKLNSKNPIKLDDYNRINDRELNTIMTKVPEGCMFTMTLDCFHGGNIYDVNRKFLASRFRGRVGSPTIEPGSVDDQRVNCSSGYPNTLLGNLFVPPVFYIHSRSEPNPKVAMERIPGPDPLTDVQATVFVWSGYTTSQTQTGVFAHAFTNTVNDLKNNMPNRDVSNREMFQEIGRRAGGASIGSKHGDPLTQLWTCSDDERIERAMVDETFVI